jgi:hypothetical protein
MVITPVEMIQQLFEERDRAKNAVTQQIFETLFTALFELFDVSHESVSWLAIDLIPNHIVVTVSVKYISSSDTSVFLKLMDRAAGASPNALSKTLRVTVPTDRVFDRVEKLKDYLIDMATTLVGPVENTYTEPKTDLEFSPKNLTKEQLEQLLLFQQTVSGAKQ